MAEQMKCRMCEKYIFVGEEYVNIDSGEYILCNDCFEALDIDEAISLFNVSVDDLLDMHNIDELVMEEGKPAPEPPIPGQMMLMDDGTLQEVMA